MTNRTDVDPLALTDLLGSIVFSGMDYGQRGDWTPTVVQQSHHDQDHHPECVRSDEDESRSSELEKPG